MRNILILHPNRSLREQFLNDMLEGLGCNVIAPQVGENLIDVITSTERIDVAIVASDLRLFQDADVDQIIKILSDFAEKRNNKLVLIPGDKDCNFRKVYADLNPKYLNITDEINLHKEAEFINEFYQCVEGDESEIYL